MSLMTGNDLLSVVPVRKLVGIGHNLPMKFAPSEEIVSVTMETSEKTVARIAKKHHLLTVPVVDSVGRLIGSIAAHDILRSLTTRDPQQSKVCLVPRSKAVRCRVVRWLSLSRVRFRRP